MDCKRLDNRTAEEIIHALNDAVASYRETGKQHTVVYSTKLRTAISMPSDPHLHEYGWDEVLTICC